MWEVIELGRCNVTVTVRIFYCLMCSIRVASWLEHEQSSL